MNTIYYRDKSLSVEVINPERGTIGWQQSNVQEDCLTEYLHTGQQWIEMEEYKRKKMETKSLNKATLEANPQMARDFALAKRRSKGVSHQIWHKSDSCFGY